MGHLRHQALIKRDLSAHIELKFNNNNPQRNSNLLFTVNERISKATVLENLLQIPSSYI